MGCAGKILRAYWRCMLPCASVCRCAMLAHTATPCRYRPPLQTCCLLHVHWVCAVYAQLAGLIDCDDAALRADTLTAPLQARWSMLIPRRCTPQLHPVRACVQCVCRPHDQTPFAFAHPFLACCFSLFLFLSSPSPSRSPYGVPAWWCALVPLGQAVAGLLPACIFCV